jgi:hypothetical protein
MANPLNTNDVKDFLDISREITAEMEKRMKGTHTLNAAYGKMQSIQSGLLADAKKANRLAGEKLNLEDQILKKRAEISAGIKKGNLTDKDIEGLWGELLKKKKELASLEKQAASESQNDLTLQKLGLGTIVGLYKEIRDLYRENPAALAAMASLSVLKNIWNVFQEIDSAAAKFRKDMGTTRDYMVGIDAMARSTAFELRGMGVSAEVAYTAIFEMGKALGSTAYVTKGLTENVSLMQSQLGIAYGTSVNFLKTMAMAAGSVADAQRNMTLFAAKLSMAAEIPLGEVMQDITNASKASYSYLSRNPLELIKAAVEARRFGTSLSATVNQSKTLLNFTANIKAEMEASVLVGKSINLERARTLAYSKDIRGLNKEILKILKDVNFNQLDPLQMDAVAAALGKTSDELSSMLQSEKQMTDLERSTRPDIQAKLKAYKEMMSSTKSRAESEAKSLDTILRIKNNAAATAAVSDAWRRITQQLAEVFLPVIAKTLEGISWVLNNINGEVLKWSGLAVGVVSGVVAIGTALLALRKLTGITAGQGIIDKLFGTSAAGASKLGKLTKTMHGHLSSLGSGINKFLTKVGGGLKTFFIDVSKGLGKGIETIFQGISKGISSLFKPEVFGGILAIGALGVALIPFMFAISKLKGLDWNSLGVAAVALIGFTGAAFGLGALMMTGAGAFIFGAGLVAFAAMGVALLALGKGAESAGTGMLKLGLGLRMTLDSLESLSVLSFSTSIIQIAKMTDAVGKLSEALKNVPTLEIEALSALSNMPVLQVTGGGAPGSATITATAGGFGEEVVSELRQMRTDFKSGAIAANVYLDGQKIDEAIGRRLLFTGQRAPP